MDNNVKAAVLTGPRRIEIKEFKKPELGPKDFLMKVRYCGVCGSDIHLWKDHWDPPYPLILGHEFIGEVADAGDSALESRNLRKGDQIAVEMIIPCHECEWCQKGFYNLCLSDDRAISPMNGVQYGCNIPIIRPPTALWGGYAQYLYVPENAIVHKFEKRVDWREAALVEPLAVSQRAINRGNIHDHQSVVIVGPGTIGLLAVVAAKAAGAQDIILTGTRDFRLNIGTTLGASSTVNITEVKDPVKEVKRLAGDAGADVVIETAGTVSAQEQSLKMVKRGGTVVLVGLTGGRSLTLHPDSDLLIRELNIMTSFLSAHAYQDAIKIMESERFKLGKVITHIHFLNEVEKAIHRVMKKEKAVIKILLDPWAH